MTGLGRGDVRDDRQLWITEVSEARDGALELTNLLNDLESVVSLLVDELDAAVDGPVSRRADHVLDAFLLAAGAGQVVDDHLHRQPHAFEAMARRMDRPVARPARHLVTAMSATLSTLTRVRDRPVSRWSVDLCRLVGELASMVCEEPIGAAAAWPLARRLGVARSNARQLLAEVPGLPASLRTDILRLPDCFRAFDQRPADSGIFAARFAARWPDRRLPVLVIGVRTSGSYLAPLQAAALVRQGYDATRWTTCRPGHRWHHEERSMLRSLGRSGGLAVLVDDPPVTGAKLAATADAVAAAGIPGERLVLLVPLLGSDEALPPLLRERQVLTLPEDRWSFHAGLETEVLTRTCDRLLSGQRVFVPALGRRVSVDRVQGVEPIPLEPISDVLARPLVRSHARLRCRVDLVDERGDRFSVDSYVKGTGLGYLGRHSWAVGRRLTGLVPPLYGWHDGFLFRQAVPESARLSSGADGDGRAIAEVCARYVAERSERLPAARDFSRHLHRRRAVWEVAGDVLLASSGAASTALRPLARRVAGDLLASPKPSVVDGSTITAHWFNCSPAAAGAGAAMPALKVDFDERAFSVWDMACYDAIWDLAGVAADHVFRMVRQGLVDDGELGRLLRQDYERRTGDSVDSERWLLYQIVHLESRRNHLLRLAHEGVGILQAVDGAPPARPDVTEPGFATEALAGAQALEEGLAAVRRRYVADTLLDGIGSPRSGPACVVKVDAVLETRNRAELTRKGALALRALLRHGYRPLLLAEDSMPGLSQRCIDYRAVGGLSSRFGLTYEHPSGRVRSVPDGGAEGALARLAGPGGCLRVDSRAAVSRILGHAPGACPECRQPALRPGALLLTAAIDDSRGRAMRTLGASLRYLLRPQEGPPRDATAGPTDAGEHELEVGMADALAR